MARKRSAIERTLHEGQDVIDAGFGTQSYKSARHHRPTRRRGRAGSFKSAGAGRTLSTRIRGNGPRGSSKFRSDVYKQARQILSIEEPLRNGGCSQRPKGAKGAKQGPQCIRLTRHGALGSTAQPQGKICDFACGRKVRCACSPREGERV